MRFEFESLMIYNLLMKKFTFWLIVIGYWLLVTSSIVEAKVLPRFRGSGGRIISSGVGVSAYLRSDRLALVVNFSNLSKANNVSYTLSYQTNGKEEGIGGSIDSSGGNSASRELLFGTCSGGVCRYHTGLTNMKLEVTTELASGRRTLRRFRVRI